MPSFKVPCPSCEAPVLIKDPKLVGTKVECPKCKYRFKVEEPAADATADPKKGDAKDKKPDAKDKKADAKKTKAAGKNKKLVPILVGVGAVVLIIVVGVVAFGGKKKTTPGGGGGGGGSVNSGGTTGGGTDGDGTAGGAGGPVAPVVPPVPFSKINTTHLLPAQAVAVYRFNMDRVRESPVHSALVDGQVRALFQKSMGFDVDDVDAYFHSFAGPTRDAFGVIKLKTPTKALELTAGMRDNLVAKPRKIKERDLYTVRQNPFVDAVSHALAMRSLFSEVYDRLPPAPPASSAKPMGLCIYDTQHILIGDTALLEKFLSELDADGYPPFKTAMNTPTPEITEPMPGMPPGAPPAPPATPPATPPVTPPATPAGADRYTTIDAYRTIEFSLKRALDLMEADKTTVPLFVYAEKFDLKQYDPALMKNDYPSLKETLGPIAARAKLVSANVVTFNQRQLIANLRVSMLAPEDSKAAAKDQLVPGMTIVADLLKSSYLTVPVEFRDYTKDGTASLPTPAGPSGIPGAGFPMGFPGSGSSMGPPPGMAGPGSGPRPNFPGSGGGPPGGLRPGIGSGGGPPGSGGKPGGPPGPMGGGPEEPGAIVPGAGQPGDPNNPDAPPARASHIDLAMIDEELLIAIDLSWSETIYRTVVAPRLVSVTNQIKGKMAVYSSGTEFAWQVIAGAGPKTLEMPQKAFPRGTAKRSSSADRFGLEYPPGSRVSLFAELLPHMGRGELARTLKRDKAWYDPDNLPAPGNDRAGAWVPELLVPDYPQSAWRAVSPLAPDHVLGATNYVAIAGTGLTIAREDPKDPAFAKKVGITGYGWGSKAEEVTDGLSNTIYMMQTPPGLQQPWIAGGGATVRGFDETNPMAAFTYSGRAKAGSYALMGDGSVRFIPADIDPKVLLAMGTRAGGESLADINKHTQKLEPPKPPEAKKEDTPAPEPKKADAKAPDAKADDPKKEEKKDPEPAPKARVEVPPPK